MGLGLRAGFAMDMVGITTSHVATESLWNYSKKQTGLSRTDFEHLTACDSCVGILNVCTLNVSLATVKHVVSAYFFHTATPSEFPTLGCPSRTKPTREHKFA
jgi:hypothetical protein